MASPAPSELEASHDGAVSETDTGDELTPELAERLIASVSRHIYLPEMAASCGTEPKLLAYWIAKGRAPNAPPLYRDFSLRFRRADAALQSKLMFMLADLARRGKSANAAVDFIDRRWPQDKESRSIDSSTANALGDDVQTLLRDPPPALVAALQQAGTVKHLLSREALLTPEAAALLKDLGYSKAEG